ncbi:hypothetical protein FXF52_20675 [Micromonospora sp. MP36]|nr:hypothetical protein FXF52_20675 [Micromonospora sp. MP36]
MGDAAAFTLADNWHGGFYELALELGGAGDDERLRRALVAVWRIAGVVGCYANRQSEPSAQDVVPCTVESLERFGHLRGVVELPSGDRLVCGAVAVREEHGADWLDFYLPLGALGRVDGRVGGYPFLPDDDDSLAWRRPVDDWLASVGRRVYDEVDFRLGLIGFEVSGDTSAEKLGRGPTSPRRIAYLVPDGEGLRYLPAER